MALLIKLENQHLQLSFNPNVKQKWKKFNLHCVLMYSILAQGSQIFSYVRFSFFSKTRITKWMVTHQRCTTHSKQSVRISKQHLRHLTNTTTMIFVTSIFFASFVMLFSDCNVFNANLSYSFRQTSVKVIPMQMISITAMSKFVHAYFSNCVVNDCAVPCWYTQQSV